LKPEFFAPQNGYHRADWPAIRAWVEDNLAPPTRDKALQDFVRAWMELLREDLGGGYFLLESPKSFLLSDQPAPVAQRLLSFIDRSSATITALLGGLAWEAAVGKDVVILFSEQDDYYQYLSLHVPDGEQPQSGGVYLCDGYGHLAIAWRDELDAANTIVHELSHSSLFHLPLPRWLDEGIAQVLERQIAPAPRPASEGDQDSVWLAQINSRPPLVWDELAERHYDYWNADNIQEFWAGTSFYQPGDPCELSYSLAEILATLLIEKGPSFGGFVARAQSADAGQTASLAIYDAGLESFAATFLGEGDWLPKRASLVKCWEKADWVKAD